jgi:hypothetical protein
MAARLTTTRRVASPPALVVPALVFAFRFASVAMPIGKMPLRGGIVIVLDRLRQGGRGQQRDHAEYQSPHVREPIVCRRQYRRDALTRR